LTVVVRRILSWAIEINYAMRRNRHMSHVKPDEMSDSFSNEPPRAPEFRRCFPEQADWTRT